MNGKNFVIRSMLGFGSFGAVWRAESTTADGQTQSVAIKEIFISPIFTLENAVTEVAYLRILNYINSTNQTNMKLPGYIDHKIGQNSMLLCMEEVQGIAMDTWLYDRASIDFKNLKVSELEKNGIAGLGGKAATMDIDQTMSLCSDYCSQMIPTFSEMNNMLIHRDVSAHNFLVHEVDNKSVFNIIDLGASTDAEPWKAGGWKWKEIGGDVRYWSPATWFNFLTGPDEMCAYDISLMNQYVMGMDQYSFAIICLEIIFNCWNMNPADEHFELLHHAQMMWWQHYIFCLETFQYVMVDGQGDLGCMRETLIEEQIHTTMLELCNDLADALQKLVEASPRFKIFSFIADFLSTKGKYSWAHAQECLQ